MLIRCASCGAENNNHAVRCARCDSLLRGIGGEDQLVPLFLMNGMTTELALRCLETRSIDNARIVLTCGHAPPAQGELVLTADRSGAFNLSNLAAPLLAIDRPINAIARFETREELLTIVRADRFELTVNARRAGDTQTIATATWSGATLPVTPLQLPLVADAPDGETLQIEVRATLLSSGSSHAIQSRYELRAGEPELVVSEGPVSYRLPFRIVHRKPIVACPKVDMRHQLAHSTRGAESSRSSSSALAFEAPIQFCESGEFTIEAPPLLLAAMSSLSLEPADDSDSSPTKLTATGFQIRARAGDTFQLRGSFVPRLLDSTLGEFIAAANYWDFRFSVRVASTGRDGSPLRDQEVEFARVQLSAMNRSCAKVALDFGTSATSIRIQWNQLAPEEFDKKTSAQQAEHLRHTIVLPKYGSFTETAPTALRIEAHGLDQEPPRFVITGETVVKDIEVGDSIFRTVSLIKRLLAESFPIYMAEETLLPHGATRVWRSVAYQAPQLAEAFLRSLALDLAVEDCLPDFVYVSFPASWRTQLDRSRLDHFTGIVQRAFQYARGLHRPDRAAEAVKALPALSEPEALLFYQLAVSPDDSPTRAAVRTADTLAIIDIGGGTTDVAVVRPTRVTDERGRSRAYLHPVLSKAVDNAGEDVTHAIARVIWQGMRREAKSSSDEHRAIRDLEFPSHPQARFRVGDRRLQSAQKVLQQVYANAENFKKTGKLVKSIVGIAFKTRDDDDSPKNDNLHKAAREAVLSISYQASEILAELVKKLAATTTEIGHTVVILGGNSILHKLMREQLERTIREDKRLGSTVEVICMTSNAKDGVALGVLLSLEEEVARNLPFRWGPDPGALKRSLWQLEWKHDRRPGGKIATAAGMSPSERIPWERDTGLQEWYFSLTQFPPPGREAKPPQVVDLSPRRSHSLERLWTPPPMNGEILKASVTLTGADEIIIAFTDEDYNVAETRASLAALIEEHSK